MGRALTTDEALRGSSCGECGTTAFPAATRCQRCGNRGLAGLELGRRGRVWGFTVQRFPPKSPPYIAPEQGFAPFAVGYVDLPEGVKVEAVLECTDFAELDNDAEVTLVAVAPVPRFATAPFLTAAVAESR